MDVREKLIELQLQADIADNISENTTEHRGFVADFMISNDVTVQEWIPVKDKLPDQNEEVLVIVNGKPQKNITLNCAYELAEYDPHEGWIMEMWPEWEGAVVTHWMPLPDPPKGE